MATALLFPGQGSHAEDMDLPWRDHPLMLAGLERLGFDPFARLGEGTAFQQPAILLCSLCAHAEWVEEHGDEDVVAAAGHSLGELSALAATGALAPVDAVALVAARGAAMADAGRRHAGTMAAFLGGEAHDVARLADELDLVVANDNAPGQVVLSGPVDAVGAAVARAGETGARARPLDVAGAFHSPLMAPAADALDEVLARVDLRRPAVPVWSGGTAAPFEDVRSELVANLTRPVRFREVLLGLRADRVERFVELGHGRVLTGLVRRTLGLREVPA